MDTVVNGSEQQNWRRQEIHAKGSNHRRVDNRVIPERGKEIRLFAVARNESLRLPYFLNYYTKMGVDRFFIIDNNSSDNTREIALEYENTHVFLIDQPYKDHWYWIEYFLEVYGSDTWCLVVDIDELLSYPCAERLSLKDLGRYLSMNGFTAIQSTLVDIYSDKLIQNTRYAPGENPLEVCRFFDTSYTRTVSDFLDKKQWKLFQHPVITGGMRQRVFGDTSGFQWHFCLTKISLFRYSKEIYLTEGMHAINGATPADIEGVVFHTKFLFDFISEAQEESLREEHYDNAIEYKIYNFHLSSKAELCLKNENSVEFKNSTQLVDLGIMTTSERFSSFIELLVEK